MTANTGGPAEEPDRLVERALLTIVNYLASCQECEFDTVSPLEAHAHSVAEAHSLGVVKHYVLRFDPLNDVLEPTT